MQKTPTEMMKEYVNAQQFQSTADIMSAMKEMFSDVIGQVMECELDTVLGYEKSQRTDEDSENSLSKNYRNGYSKKRVKRSLARLISVFHGIAMVNMNRESSKNMTATLTVWKKRSSGFMLAG